MTVFWLSRGSGIIRFSLVLRWKRSHDASTRTLRDVSCLDPRNSPCHESFLARARNRRAPRAGAFHRAIQTVIASLFLRERSIFPRSVRLISRYLMSLFIFLKVWFRDNKRYTVRVVRLLVPEVSKLKPELVHLKVIGNRDCRKRMLR